MKLAKTLGLAVLATMVATAFVGASSAIAEPEHPEIVLCKNAELVCELENWWGYLPATETHSPAKIHLEAKAALKLLTSLNTVDCETSLAIVTLLNLLGKKMVGHLLSLTFEECSRLKIFGGKEACTVTVNELGALLLTPGEPKLLANAESIEIDEKSTNATVVCGSIINCTYEASAETELRVHSDPELGHLLLLANDTPLKGVTEEGICPETSKWHATYHAVNLDEELTLKLGLWIEL